MKDHAEINQDHAEMMEDLYLFISA